jgi:hypothetical protein
MRVAFALPVPSAGAAASSLSRTVKVSKKASCKKANNLRKKVFELGTYVKRVCSSSGSNFTESEQCEMLFDVRLRGTAFTAPLPSFDAEFPVKGTVTGHAGASGAGGQGNIPAGGDSGDTCGRRRSPSASPRSARCEASPRAAELAFASASISGSPCPR